MVPCALHLMRGIESGLSRKAGSLAGAVALPDNLGMGQDWATDPTLFAALVLNHPFCGVDPFSYLFSKMDLPEGHPWLLRFRPEKNHALQSETWGDLHWCQQLCELDQLGSIPSS